MGSLGHSLKLAYQKCFVILATTALTAFVLMNNATRAWAVGAQEVPTGHAVVSGSATFATPAPGQLNINQGTERVIINWNSFNIGTDATTRFSQPHSSSLAVNRVLNSGADPTQILGSLQANGRLMVLDRNGIIFGKDSQINVGGIIASTGDVSNETVMSGTASIPLQNMADAPVKNEGTITVSDAGLAALVAPTVVNNGSITAKVGKVYLAAAENATVDLYGDGLVSMATDSNLTHALISNTGKISAQGGTVTISTAVARNIVDNVINLDGVVNASSATAQGGKVILGGDANISVAGDVNVRGATGGGNVTIKGHDLSISGSVNAQSTSSGKGGHIELFASNKNKINGVVKASGIDGGGNIEARGTVITVGAEGYVVAESTGSGSGGHIDLFGRDSTDIQSVVKASGIDGGGNIEVRGTDINIGEKGYVVAEAIGSGKGGHVDLFGTNSTIISGVTKATGTNGGGNIEARGNQITVGGVLVAEGTVSGLGGHIDLVGGDRTLINGTLKASGRDGGGHIKATGDEVNTGTTAVLKAKDGSIRFYAESLVDLGGGYFGADHFNMDAPTVNFSGDTHIATTNLFLNTGTINLNALILGSGDIPVVDPLRFTSNATVVNVLSDAAMIQQGIYLAGSGATVTVADGDYFGSLLIDRALTLQGDGSLPLVTVSTPQPSVITILADDVTINGFRIDGRGSDVGIRLTGNDDIVIKNNILLDNATGLDGLAYGNGDIELSGNHFINNVTGAAFGSGLIDLTGNTNYFAGGDTALFFSRASSGSQFADLTLVNDTIGSTIFTGQTTYYVDLENGAFFEPGRPTHLNGLDATFDGIRPADTNGALTLAQYNRLEAMIHHYVDDPTLGLFFFGFPPETDNETLGLLLPDLFPEYYYRVGTHGFSVTITALPHVGSSGGDIIVGNVAVLADLEPAAGGNDSSYANVQDIANIEPAAGGIGEVSPCWNNTVSNAAQGVRTTFIFGDTVESQLEGTASCANGQQSF